ncbi:MAG TPA: GNAT family protein [Anaerolineae bacterium]|nr:GNAT family protein [Anaerolineae bacterium]
MEKPILKGERVRLRPLVAADAAVMWAHIDNPVVNRLTGTQGRFTLAQVEAYCAGLAEADDRADYGIEIEGAEAYIGEAVLNEIDRVNRVANYRIAIYEERFFGQGYGTEATRLMLQYAFEFLNLHRVELEVYAFNARAAHVYEKVGFRREGVRREVLLWDGEYYDAIVMGLLKREWQVLSGDNRADGI